MCRRSGFTLVELMLSIALISIVAVSAISVTRTGGLLHRTTTATVDAESRTNRALNQVLDELKNAGLDTLNPTLSMPGDWSSTLLFRQAIGATGSGTALGNVMRLQLLYETGELDDGLDNNGNGLIDEGRLVFTRDVGLASQASVTWCHGIAEYLEGESAVLGDENGNGLDGERGLCFERQDGLVIIRLSVQRLLPERSGLLTRTLETGIRLVN